MRGSERSSGSATPLAPTAIVVPAAFIGGASDWGLYQAPDSFETMPSAFADWRGTHIVPAAGHWSPQEQPEAVNALLLQFLAELVEKPRAAA